MIKNVKKNIVGSMFIFIVSALMILNIVICDLETSERENRYLQMFPEITLEDFLSGKLSEELLDYADDQFAAKDLFVKIKSYVNFNIFRKQLNNGIYRYDGMLVEFMDKIKYGKLDGFKSDIDAIMDLTGRAIMTVIVPDKSMYLPDGMLKIDYSDVLEYLDMEIFDLYGLLSMDDYYSTDLHWNHMGAYKAYESMIEKLTGDKPMDVDFEKSNDSFMGYYSNMAMDFDIRDDMYIGYSEIINSLKIAYTDDLKNYYDKTGPYFLEQLDGDDKYDMFLNGNHPVLTITNELCDNDRELIIFKDSYANSIAPFLAMHYNKVTLVDLRIVNLDRIMQDLDMDSDILCLYGYKTLQDGAIMK